MNQRLAVAKRIAAFGMIAIFAASIVFHIFSIVGVVPYAILWGGRITSQTELFVLESVSIILNTLFLNVVLAKRGILQFRVSERLLNRVLNITLRVMAVLFFLNTIGNVMSTNTFEQQVFTPITFLLSVFALILALEEHEAPLGGSTL